ncbi:ATP-binding cassette sub-family C member 4-like isoform X2 [Polyergus mexicanus]|uniref:ATP-binding cassette sub-family C member 4-like isoform X2 n=1 Tax=Polyergus mexicanus TaxID=615972 RepID=UPI0038B6A707
MNKNTTRMKRNPKETANIFSQLFLWWTLNLFLKSSKTDLEESDIYQPLKEDESEKVTDHLEECWNRELEKLKKLEYTVDKDGQKVPLKRNTRPRLYKALFGAFWLPYFIIGIYIFIQGWIISYFMGESNATNMIGKNKTTIYITCLVICTFCSTLLSNHTTIMSQQIGMRLRVACSSLVYRKILRLNQTSLSQTGAGQIVNLLSNDVNRFDSLSVCLNYIWIMPIQVIIVGYIMWRKIGVSIFIGIGLLLIISLPIQGTFSLLSHDNRAMIAPLTDRRVQLMNELIAGIQVIKMYAWEKPFSKIVSITRALEIKKIQFSSYVRAAHLAIAVFTERLLLYFTLIMFVLSGNDLNADVTYTLATFFNILQLTVASFFPQALISLGEAMVSMNRLEDLLLMDEVNMECIKKTLRVRSKDEKLNKATAMNNRIDVFNYKTSEQELYRGRPVCVKLHRVSASWINNQLPPTLCNISAIINPGELYALVGPVGSGKSSVLHLLLKELNPGAGSVIFTHDISKNVSYDKLVNGYYMDNLNPRISYASQEPWLFNGTVKDNILFGQPFDRIRYTEVTNVCALRKDFQQFPHGDTTIVGERGVSLSGGQRARINLARAVYRQADLYLLDDPLSAVDTHVAKHLYKKCITEYLHGRTRILVTHQLQFIKRVDHIIVLNRGFVKMQGSYNKLVESNKDFIQMMDELTTSHETQKKEENARRISEMSSKNISVFKRTSEVTIASSIVYSEIDDSDYVQNNLDGEAMIHGQVSSKVYRQYFHYGGNYFILFVLLLFFIISRVALTGNDYWVSYWTNMEHLRQNQDTIDATRVSNMDRRNDSFLASIFILNSDGLLSTIDAIYVYTFCIVTCTATTLLCSFFFMKICMNSSVNLYNTMFSDLLQARMSFFHTNSSGQILNRFSKDIGTIDEMLPKIMLKALQIDSALLAILIMESILNQWMIIPIMILAILFFFITKSYLRTVQNLKRLEGISKSPLFSHVNTTLNGLPTIRSTGIEKMMRNKFDALQDTHNGVWYQILTCGTAFAIILDTIACLFIACLSYSFILIDENDSISGSEVGLTISQSLTLTGGLEYGIKQIIETFSLMTAVERILQYTNLPAESAVISDDPPLPTWPSQGQLTFKDVSMKYDKNDPFVLKNLNFSIEPGWKIGVVGRTGAGKSSLISALFRLFDEGLKGEIIIDGRETSTVGLRELRSKISIIPQEPVLFSESLRYNLDPFNQYDDVKLWEVLRLVELNEIALDHNILYGGHNLSVGQRQLVCLARAILRNNRLLVLDEATANIDSHTDALIQDTIRKNFKDCTVITIAHRLNTIIDSDRIIVMENGCIVEFGSPYELLHKPDGYFKQMVEKTGKQMSQNLLKQATKAYQINDDDNLNLNLSTQNSGESDIIITEQTKL